MESFYTFAQSALFSHYLITVGAVALVAYFWLRVGSISSILERLWLLAAGKADVHDAALKDFFVENRDLEKFRFVFGIKVDTQENLHKLLLWMKDHNVGMPSVQKVRNWIKLESPEVIAQPTKTAFIGLFIVALVSIVVTDGAAIFGVSPSAYLQMRASKVWFKTDAVTAQGPFERWSFNAQSCDTSKAEMIRITGFSASETDALCRGLKENTLKPFVEKAVRLQHFAAIGIGIVALLSSIFSLRFLSSAGAADSLRKRLYASKKDDTDANEKPSEE